MDTKWPGIRTWELDNPVEYEKWEEIKIVADSSLVKDERIMYVDYPYIIKDVEEWSLVRIESWLLDIRIFLALEHLLAFLWS